MYFKTCYHAYGTLQQVMHVELHSERNVNAKPADSYMTHGLLTFKHMQHLSHRSAVTTKSRCESEAVRANPGNPTCPHLAPCPIFLSFSPRPWRPCLYVHVLLTCLNQQMHDVLMTMLGSSQQSIGQIALLQGTSQHQGNTAYVPFLRSRLSTNRKQSANRWIGLRESFNALQDGQDSNAMSLVVIQWPVQDV